MTQEAFENRDYQDAATNSGIDFFENPKGKNGVSVIPTGGGKSVVIGGIVTHFVDESLVLQPSKEILKQNFLKAQKFMRQLKMSTADLGVYSASFGMRQRRRITFATIGSVEKNPEIFVGVKRIIMDECDLANAKGGMYEKFFNKLGIPVLGMTDSPYRLHPPSSGHNSIIKFIHRTRPRIFSKLLHITQNEELFRRGFLTTPEYVKENFDPDLLSYNSTGAEFTEASVRRYSQDTDFVGKMARYCKEIDTEHVMVVCNDVAEATALHRRLASVGTDSLLVHGEMEMDRDEAETKFKTGAVRIAIVCGMWTVGFDFPELDGVINGKITNSARLYKQVVGRGVRLREDRRPKKYRYIDLGGNVQRFGRVETFEITGPAGKERLRSDVGFLTGVDLKTRYDLEAARENGEDPYLHLLAPADGSAKIGFGKYKGQQISAVPVGYLYWLSKEGESPQARQQALVEIRRRNVLKGQQNG